MVAPAPVVAPPAAPLATPLAAAAAPAGLDPLTAPAEALGLPARGASATAEPTWPCVTCGAGNLLTASVCAACGAGFLAGLREAEGPLLELPVVGDLTRLPRAQRLGLALAIVLVVLALIVGIGLLSG